MQDPGTFEKLCQEHRNTVLAYAYVCSNDLHVAEDITQETLVIAFRKQEQYFSDADFKCWLISIARNVWFRERERRKLTVRRTHLIEENAELLFSGEEYAEEAWEKEKQALSRCLAKLEEPDRGILRDHFVGNLKYAEIADKMQKTLSWVTVRMFRSREALRKCVRAAMARGETEWA